MSIFSENKKIIEYGNLGKSGDDPISGDAFDCDVNGDGIYDSETERFYYITDFPVWQYNFILIKRFFVGSIAKRIIIQIFLRKTIDKSGIILYTT